MTLDVRAFWLIGALTSSSCGLLVLILRKQYPNHLGRALALFGAANLVLGLNYALRLGHSFVGDFPFFVVASTLVTLCLSLEYAAVCILKCQRILKVWVIGPPLIIGITCSYWTLVQRNISIANMVANAVNAAVMLVIADAFVKREGGRRPFPDVVAAGAYALLAAFTFLIVLDAIKEGWFPAEYNFNLARSIANNIAAILAEGIIFSIFLLTLSERLNRTILEQAMHDPLTHLYNRRAFEEVALREISGAKRSGSASSLLVIDLDYFKLINDRYGHAMGDEVLRGTARALRSILRQEDFLARWGGDEFCALLPRAGRREAEAAAARILATLARGESGEPHAAISLSVSIGIASLTRGDDGLSSLFVRADQALYRVKLRGRNGYEFGSELESEPAPAPPASLAHLPSHDLPSTMA